ncbi:MAG: signal peptidase I [Defluviitaleaceae bacterium]|nr:signal peptidase I [Defluviitaleaceae bacterium]
MNYRNMRLSLIVCLVLISLFIVFLLIPVAWISIFNMAVRSLVFAVLSVIIFVQIGIDARPLRAAYVTNLIAVASAGLLGMVFLSASFLYGVAVNPMAPNLGVIFNNLWQQGFVAILSVYLQCKLIRNAIEYRQLGLIIVLTIVFALTNMGGLRAAIDGAAFTADLFFITIFRPLTISIALSYFAFRGGLLSATLFGIPYAMLPFAVPVTPNIGNLAFSLLVAGAAFVSLIVCNFATSEKSRILRVRTNRMAKYSKKSALNYAFFIGFIIALVTFFGGVFPVYPVVVLTGSMEPTISRGSIAIIERVPPQQTFDEIEIGDIIHFGRNNTPFVHRVTEYWYDLQGVRHYVTQGDATSGPDAFPVPPDEVIGVVWISIPFFGFPYIFFQDVLNVFN